jgi:hypothetical protein
MLSNRLANGGCSDDGLLEQFSGPAPDASFSGQPPEEMKNVISMMTPYRKNKMASRIKAGPYSFCKQRNISLKSLT